MIRLADDLDLGPDAVTQNFALMGRKGSGKTYGAGRLVEQLLADRQQVAILDPVGVWFGLRLDATGEHPSRFDIPVLGGQHGDVGLDASMGAAVATLVGENGLSAILDVSEMTGADQRRFVTDFAVGLFQAKKRHRSPVMIVLEEAQEFAPQLVRPDHARMVGAIEKLVKLGRNFGIGTTLISQRPQAVNKDVLNQSEVLLAFQLTGPQERKAIDGWVQEHGADRSVANSLPALPVGTALVWSPQWLRVFGQYKILPKETFDASRTPVAGTDAPAVRLGGIDPEQLRNMLGAVAAKLAADDPVALRTQLAAALKEADNARMANRTWERKAEDANARAERAKAEPQVVTERVEVPLLSPEDWELLSQATTALRGVLDGFATAEDRIRGLLGKLVPPPDRALLTAHQTARRSAPTAIRSLPAADTSGRLPKAETSILKVLAQYPNGRSKRQVAMLTDYSSKGGGFANALSSLRSKGLIEGREVLTLTAAGRSAPIEYAPLPRGAELLAHWLGTLAKAERSIVEVLVAEAGPLSKETVAERTGYAASGGGFWNALSRLRTLEIIERGADIRLHPDFAEAIAS